MSIPHLRAVVDLDLPPTEKLVLLILANFADKETGLCWPAVETVSKQTGLADRSVQRSTRALTAKGLVAPVGRRCNSNGRKTVLYAVLPNELSGGSASPDARSPDTKPHEARQLRVTGCPLSPDAPAPNPSGTTKKERARALSIVCAKPGKAFYLLPEGWLPTRPLSPDVTAKVAEWLPGAFESELESFKAHFFNADPVKGKGKKKDWHRAFENWIREADRRLQRGGFGRWRTGSRNEEAFRAVTAIGGAGATF